VAAWLEFSLLGPLSVERDGYPIPIPVGRQRALLAALLLNRGRVVPANQLIEALWGSDPPPSARPSLHNYVKRLRKALGDTAHSRIQTHPGGYAISAAADELDLSRFEALLRAARSAQQAGQWDEAAARSHAALSLWRGEPLADVESEVLAQREIPWLAELRLQALEIRLEADLHLGAQVDVIPELQRLVGGHPLREQLHALLMLALFQAGRQGEALAAYREARQLLIDELGTEPGPGLREMQRRILSADAAPVAPRPAPTNNAESAGPSTLPAAVRHFSGRDEELAVLDELAESAAALAPGMAVISAIDGTAGVGKTALAVHWAHQATARFPDGQLYVNLRGYDPDRPMSPADALAGFLRTLGVAGPQIPADAEERAAHYRSLLAGRKILILLDNAGSAEQVRPLLPAAAGCVTVVTSRDSLAGLVAREGARRIDLDLLSLGQAAELLNTLIGERAAAEPDAIRTLAAQCSRLPLALRIAAERAAARPGADLLGLIAELTDERRRLDLLDAGGDPRTALRAVFSWSYRQLDPVSARCFRLFGLPSGPDLDSYATAALIGVPLDQARDLLGLLARANLLQATQPGRYSLHDLLRVYSRELAGTQDSRDDQTAALTRLFDYYLYTAANAADVLFPAEQSRRPRVDKPATPIPPIVSNAAARAWLDAERSCLVSAAEHAALHGWPGHATRMAITLYRYLDGGAHYSDALAVHTHARDAARSVGDGAAEAQALNHLGAVEVRQSRYQHAAGHLQEALLLFRAASDRAGEARALANLGFIDFQQSRYPEAVGHLEQSLALHHTNGDQAGEARALANLGLIMIRQSRYEQASGYLQRALSLFGRRGDRRDEALTLANLGEIDLRQGCYEQAIGRLEQSLAVCRQVGDRQLEADALNGLGEAFLAAGRPVDARTRHAAALDSAGQIGNAYEQARAHNGLAHSYDASGNGDRARSHWLESLDLYIGLGAPEADQIRRQLARMADGGRDG
jgi:DNA-binding SARP family transcriptional activator/Tfp pilus assembly protein PilF